MCITIIALECDYPDSKWKLGQHWVLSCYFRWANVGCAMQNHPHFAHPKNVGPTCCTNVGPTCCTNVGPTCCTNVGRTCCANVGPTMLYKRWPNMLGKRWLSVWLSVSKWKLLTMFFFNFHFLNGSHAILHVIYLSF